MDVRSVIWDANTIQEPWDSQINQEETLGDKNSPIYIERIESLKETDKPWKLMEKESPAEDTEKEGIEIDIPDSP